MLKLSSDEVLDRTMIVQRDFKLHKTHSERLSYFLNQMKIQM